MDAGWIVGYTVVPRSRPAMWIRPSCAGVKKKTLTLNPKP